MSRRHQTVLVSDPECFNKALPSIRVTAGTCIPADDDNNIVIGFTSDGSTNDVFEYVPAHGIYGDMFRAKRPCTLMYSSAVFRDTTTSRGVILVAQGGEAEAYGQVSATIYSTGVSKPAGEALFDVSGIATLDTGDALSFLLDNDSVSIAALTMVITSVNPA